MLLNDGASAHLTVSARRGQDRWVAQLSTSIPGLGRPAAGGAPNPEAATHLWVTRHANLLGAGEVDRLCQAPHASRPLSSCGCEAGPSASAASSSCPHRAAAGPGAADAAPAAARPAAEPPPRPGWGAAASGPASTPLSLKCPLCPGVRAFARPRNLTRHLVARHAGHRLGREGAAVLRGLDFGICGGCGGVRSYRAADCPHCPAPAPPPRPARAEDVLRRLAPGRAEARAAAPARVVAELPEDWVARLERLPSDTVPHIPGALRDAMAAAMAQSFEAMVDDGPDAALEQGRAKLLLSPPPRQLHIRSELQRRLTLWEQGDFAALLARAEAQAAERRAARTGRSGPNKARRARQLAREQAFRKAVTALTGSLADLSPAEETRWAAELLPRARPGGPAPASVDLAPTQLDEEMPTPLELSAQGSPAPLPTQVEDSSLASVPVGHAEAAMPWQAEDDLADDAVGGGQAHPPAVFIGTPPRGGGVGAADPWPFAEQQQHSPAAPARELDDAAPPDIEECAGSPKLSAYQRALGGVRFPGLTAAGPTGARPEHLRESLQCRKRAQATRLLKALARLVDLGKAGNLPDSCRWILDSKLVFLRKPGTDTPRPIRVGELLRRIIAKRLVSDNQSCLQRLFLSRRQCGVGLPGGAEALIHARRCLEQSAAESDVPLAVLDLDLRNCFPSLEWHAVDAAVRELAPQLGPWTEWSHRGQSRVWLPGGGCVASDRGAEQGDPLGPAYCGLVLAGCAQEAREAVERIGGWAVDWWYMDDGQIILPTSFATTYLEAFDAALLRVGGTRVGADGKFKSVARAVGSPAACARLDASWAEGIVARTCRVAAPTHSPLAVKVLGIELDGDDLSSQLLTATAHTAAVRHALRQLDDPRAEIALLRVSANACRLVHLMRAAGPDLPHEALEEFDRGQRDALAVTVGGGLCDESWSRAVAGAKQGGLGIRRAADLRLPAFIASRTEARGLCEILAADLPSGPREALFARWDDSLAEAISQWRATLPASTGAVAEQLLEEAGTTAACRAARLAGHLPPEEHGHSDEFSRGVARGLLLGPDDDEHPDSPDGLQSRLLELVCGRRVAGAQDDLLADNRVGEAALWSDLCDTGTDHGWMWVLAAADNSILSKAEFVAAVRLRIGADIAEPGMLCARCGCPLDRKGHHSLRCAPGASTQGHNRVKDTILGLASLADGAAATEVPGLIASAPLLRPADVLTTAACGRLTALDVGIANPEARTAGVDAAASMVRRKREDYAAYVDELADDDIEYRPVVWTCWGRPHVDALTTLRGMASAAARKHGAVSPEEIFRRANRAVGTQIWKRAARMVLACLPPMAADDLDKMLPTAIAAATRDRVRGAADDSDDESRGSSKPDSEGPSEPASGASTPRASAQHSDCPLPGLEQLLAQAAAAAGEPRGGSCGSPAAAPAAPLCRASLAPLPPSGLSSTPMLAGGEAVPGRPGLPNPMCPPPPAAGLAAVTPPPRDEHRAATPGPAWTGRGFPPSLPAPPAWAGGLPSCRPRGPAAPLTTGCRGLASDSAAGGAVRDAGAATASLQPPLRAALDLAAAGSRCGTAFSAPPAAASPAAGAAAPSGRMGAIIDHASTMDVQEHEPAEAASAGIAGMGPGGARALAARDEWPRGTGGPGCEEARREVAAAADATMVAAAAAGGAGGVALGPAGCPLLQHAASGEDLAARSGPDVSDGGAEGTGAGAAGGLPPRPVA